MTDILPPLIQRLRKFVDIKEQRRIKTGRTPRARLGKPIHEPRMIMRRYQKRLEMFAVQLEDLIEDRILLQLPFLLDEERKRRQTFGMDAKNAVLKGFRQINFDSQRKREAQRRRRRLERKRKEKLSIQKLANDPRLAEDKNVFNRSLKKELTPHFRSKRALQDTFLDFLETGRAAGIYQPEQRKKQREENLERQRFARSFMETGQEIIKGGSQEAIEKKRKEIEMLEPLMRRSRPGIKLQPSELKQNLQDLESSFNETISDLIDDIADAGGDITQWTENKFDEMLGGQKGLDIFSKRALESEFLEENIEAWAEQNVRLIKGMSDRTMTRVQGIIEGGVRSGDSLEKIAEDIYKVTLKNRSDAKLIARDQTSKLNSSLTKMRSRNLGLELYEWSSSADENVRTSHEVLDGMLCRYDDPTVYSDDDGKTWKSRSSIGGFIGDPGEDIQCRCVGLAVLDEIKNFEILSDSEKKELAAIEKERKEAEEEILKKFRVLKKEKKFMYPPEFISIHQKEELFKEQRASRTLLEEGINDPITRRYYEQLRKKKEATLFNEKVGISNEN